jgi:hypothetical protein
MDNFSINDFNGFSDHACMSFELKSKFSVTLEIDGTKSENTQNDIKTIVFDTNKVNSLYSLLRNVSCVDVNESATQFTKLH